MRLIKIQMELVLDDIDCADDDAIAYFLNNKLYTDPEFFGDFGPENIISVKEIE